MICLGTSGLPIVPSERNYLLNPAHPDFSRIRFFPPRPFAFDRRLKPARHYKFPARIEYEYNTPPGSDVVSKVKMGVQFCKDAPA